MNPEPTYNIAQRRQNLKINQYSTLNTLKDMNSLALQSTNTLPPFGLHFQQELKDGR